MGERAAEEIAQAKELVGERAAKEIAQAKECTEFFNMAVLMKMVDSITAIPEEGLWVDAEQSMLSKSTNICYYTPTN